MSKFSIGNTGEGTGLNPDNFRNNINSTPSSAELRKAIKKILQPLAASVASKILSIDVRRAYRLKAERELVALFQAHQQQLLSELLGARGHYIHRSSRTSHETPVEAVPVSVIEQKLKQTNDGGKK